MGWGGGSQQGQARFFTFTLAASREDFFYGAEATVSTYLMDYLDTFTMHLRGMFFRHFKGVPALFCLFDGTTNCLPWHVPLDLENPGKMHEFLATNNETVQGGSAPAQVIECLRAVLQPPFEDWGTFAVESGDVSSLKFTYDERCKTAILDDR